MLTALAQIPREGVGIYADLFYRLYRETVSAETKCGITFALLDAFASRHKADVESIILKRAVARIFGLNVIGAKQFNECFERWLAGRSSQLIILPT